MTAVNHLPPKIKSVTVSIVSPCICHEVMELDAMIFAFEYVALGFIIAFLPRIKCILILCLQLPSTKILEPKKEKSSTASTFSPSICHEVMELDAMTFVF